MCKTFVIITNSLLLDYHMSQNIFPVLPLFIHRSTNMYKLIIQVRIVYDYLGALMKEHNALTKPKQRASVYGYHSCHLLSN